LQALYLLHFTIIGAPSKNEKEAYMLVQIRKPNKREKGFHGQG